MGWTPLRRHLNSKLGVEINNFLIFSRIFNNFMDWTPLRMHLNPKVGVEMHAEGGPTHKIIENY